MSDLMSDSVIKKMMFCFLLLLYVNIWFHFYLNSIVRSLSILVFNLKAVPVSLVLCYGTIYP